MNQFTASPTRLPIHSLQNSFTYSINPSSSPEHTYNFHQHASPSPYSSPHSNKSLSYARPQQIPSENLNLADQHSFARNYKARLYGIDQNQEEAKQLKRQQYRQQLLMQAEEDRRRKKEAKEKADAEDAKLERDFYANIGIEALKKEVKKEEPSYFMMRTSRAGLSKQNSLANSRTKEKQQNSYVESEDKKGIAAAQFSKKDNVKRTLYEHPKIMKIGGYHNQSSLDHQTSNPEQNIQSQPLPPSNPIPKELSKSLHFAKQREDSIDAQLKYQQQRIHQILMFQEHMLKKLEYFKKDVIVASQSLHLDDELEKVRLRLRAKPLNMNKVHHLNPKEGIDNVMEDSSFYHLPLISTRNKVFEGSRELRKRKEKEKKFRQLRSNSLSEPLKEQETEPKEVVKLEDRRKRELNDKNILFTPNQNEEEFQGNQNEQ